MKQLLSVLVLTAIGVAVARGQDADAQSPENPPEAEDAGQQSATDRALEELATAYEGLAGLFDQRSGEAVESVQQDIENLGDWEYRIVELPDGLAERQEAALNELGNDRWEVYWVESSPAGIRFYLKRPSVSYLSRVPLSTLVRVLAGAAQ
jgi:hypothetical protein